MYLANVLKCRPPQNRDPLEAEIAACEPHLFRQIELVRPRVVATLGNFATKLLSGRSFGITRVHGQEHEVTLASTTVILYPVYHPAAALYTPSMLKALEDDFARLPALLGRPRTPVAPRIARRASATPPKPVADPTGEDERDVGRRRSARPLLSAVLELITQSAAETEAFGAALAGLLRPGDVVLLRGELGAGKTTLVRGACRALGIEEPVTSPTFTIGHLYRGRRPWRTSISTASSGSAPRNGATSSRTSTARSRSSSGPRRASALPPARVSLELEHVAPDERRISVDSPDRTLLEDLARADPRVRHRN